jgi:hypothetical protein
VDKDDPTMTRAAKMRAVYQRGPDLINFRTIAPSTQTTTEVSLSVGDPQLGLLNLGNAFPYFVATRGSTTSGPNGDDTAFTFSTPFKMMLNPGVQFQFASGSWPCPDTS